MREIIGDLWQYHARGAWACITTNGDVNKLGEAVMGRGTAAQAKEKFPGLPLRFGKQLAERGNRLLFFSDLRLIAFPVKHHWREQADLALIRRSAEDLAAQIKAWPNLQRSEIYLPRPGCGNGKLDWEDVRDILFDILPGNVVAISKGG